MNEAAFRTNHNLREEIQAYWSLRAETFDLQPGHEIFSEAERRLARAVAQASGRRRRTKSA